MTTASPQRPGFAGQITGNVGLYYVCYRMSRLGWNVMPTARNARGIDIVGYAGQGHGFVSVQVKTLSRRDPVPLGNTLDKIAGEFWVIVTRASLEAPVSYVMLPGEVRDGAHRGERENRVSYWLQPRAYDRPDFFERWDRIALKP